MIRVVVLLAAAIPYVLGQTCEDILVANNDPAECEQRFQGPEGEICCECFGSGGNCEGCQGTQCPTDAPSTDPTPAPTDQPTKSPTPGPSTSPSESPVKTPTDPPTKSPTPSPSPSPSEKPETGAPSPGPTEKPETSNPTKSPVTSSPTEKTATRNPSPSPSPSPTSAPTPCECTAEVEACVTATTANPKPDGCGVGECDCQTGIAELRFKYRGTADPVDIVISTGKNNPFEVCEFTDVIPGQEVICNVFTPGPNLITNTLESFRGETPFVITGPNGYTCSGQYHTSCSQDIVGVVLEECPDLVVSGWKDVYYLQTGGDCDDGIEGDCTCGGNTPDTTEPCNKIKKKIGDICYCKNEDVMSGKTGGSSSSGSSGSSGSKNDSGSKNNSKNKSDNGKKKKSKNNRGSKHKQSKSKKSGGGHGDDPGYGDCDCDESIGELTMRWAGEDTVDVTFYYDGSSPVCTIMDIKQGEEFTCNARDNGFDRFSINTDLRVLKTGTTTQVCVVTFPTTCECSDDIIYTYGQGCQDFMENTGWKDNANLDGDGGFCDDGLEQCPCDDGIVQYGFDNSGNIAQLLTDVCYCSDDPSAGIPNADGDYEGIGTCTCTAGSNVGTRLDKLRFLYLPRTKEEFIAPVDIQVCLDADCFVPIQSFAGVYIGEELEVDMANFNWQFFDTTTYFTVSEAGVTISTGSLPTGCGEDIIGFSLQGSTSITVTGWKDAFSSEDCDDGYYPCTCTACAQFSTDSSNGASECAQQAACFVNEGLGTCESLSGTLFLASDAPKAAGKLALFVVGLMTMLYL